MIPLCGRSAFASSSFPYKSRGVHSSKRPFFSHSTSIYLFFFDIFSSNSLGDSCWSFFHIRCSENALFFLRLSFNTLGPAPYQFFIHTFFPPPAAILFKMKSSTIAFSLLITTAAARSLGAQQKRATHRTFIKRELPQEHSHEIFLTTVTASLNLNNPAKISDAVFGLLGADVRISFKFFMSQ